MLLEQSSSEPVDKSPSLLAEWGLTDGRGYVGSSARALLAWMLLLVLMFGYVYNLVFQAAPLATSGRVALLLLLPFCWRRTLVIGRRLVRTYPGFFAFSTLAYAYSLILWRFSGDSTLALRAFYLLSYTVLGAVMWVAIAEKRGWCLDAIFAASALIQALFVLYSLLTPSFRHWLPTFLVPAGNISLEDSIRPPGLTNAGGAALSVAQGIGVFAAFQTGERTSGLPRLLWHVAGLVCIVSALLTGRSGLLLALGGAALVALTGGTKYRRWLLAVFICLLAVASISLPKVLSEAQDRIPTYDRLSAWATEFFSSGMQTASVEGLRDQPIPPLSLETVVGTGQTVTEDGTNASQSDSGYVQTYYAIGLPMAVLWYLAIFGFLFRLAWRSENRTRLIGLAISLAVLEMKEPFTFKWVFPFALVCFALSTRADRGDEGGSQHVLAIEPGSTA